jgi:Fic family protein
MVKYSIPQAWLNYNIQPLVGILTEAKAAILSLVNIPYQRSWVEALQAIQLKREIAGTSRIEGADFTERELDLALKETPEVLLTRSQKQEHAAMKAYKWISELAIDVTVDGALIKSIHELIIGDADSDHCPPGVIRRRDENVTFGVPPHRGCDGGTECEGAFNHLMEAVRLGFQQHDLLIQALALHFHFAVMHPFLDGNGRTARAVEALMLRRAGLTDHLFIAMSNYYYDEKTSYLSSLSAVCPPHYDLTPFLIFGLKGIKIQCERLFREIRVNVQKSIFKNTMYDLFGRLQTRRKTVLAKRQRTLLELVLEKEHIPLRDLLSKVDPMYKTLKAGRKAAIRDIIHLLNLGAVNHHSEGEGTTQQMLIIDINLDWPQQITESGFMEKCQKMPTAKSYGILAIAKAA